MSTRRYLFVCLDGRVSFWEYSNGTPRPCSIQKEHSLPLTGFWDRWKASYRLDDDEPRDFLFLSDRSVARAKLPGWFFGPAMATSCWTGERLGDVFAKWEPCKHRTIAVQVQERRSVVWHGGDSTSPMVLHAISTLEFAPSSAEVEEEQDDRGRMTKALLAAAESRHFQNKRRCTSRR